VINGANVKSLPTVMPPFNIGTEWKIDAKRPISMTVRIRESLPSGASRILIKGTVKIPPGHNRINLSFDSFHVDEEGEHVMSVEYKKGSKWVTAADLPIEVHVEASSNAAGSES